MNKKDCKKLRSFSLCIDDVHHIRELIIQVHDKYISSKHTFIFIPEKYCCIASEDFTILMTPLAENKHQAISSLYSADQVSSSPRTSLRACSTCIHVFSAMHHSAFNLSSFVQDHDCNCKNIKLNHKYLLAFIYPIIKYNCTKLSDSGVLTDVTYNLNMDYSSNIHPFKAHTFLVGREVWIYIMGP